MEMKMNGGQIHGRIEGAIVVIGFGSIGRGVLPLIERHFEFNKERFYFIDPDASHRTLLDARGINFINIGLTEVNYREVLTPLLTGGEGQSVCISLAVEVSSLDIMMLCRHLRVLYLDTVVEPWPGFYFNPALKPSARSNYALRERIIVAKRQTPGGTTAISCCGANPGAVSWLVKQALLNIVSDLGQEKHEPRTRDEWAALMRDVGVKGIHIAERDTQRSHEAKPRGVFVNTWSVEGFLSEGLQPAELGWGTHEKILPPNAHKHTFGSGAAIYLMQPGAATQVRSWTPTAGPQHGWMITHNESISIADYYTIWEQGNPVYRPTCHYAYHPCDDAVLSLHELKGSQWRRQEESKILTEHELADGIDELGVLLYGHPKNAYWYGSQLSIQETRELAPYQNATGLQVTSGVLAGIVWLLENPDRGIVEADEMDFRRCLEIQRPYLGPVIGRYTEWTPVDHRGGLFPENVDRDDPWQFSNILVS